MVKYCSGSIGTSTRRLGDQFWDESIESPQATDLEASGYPIMPPETMGQLTVAAPSARMVAFVADSRSETSSKSALS